MCSVMLPLPKKVAGPHHAAPPHGVPPRPIVSPNTILAVGVFLYLLACIWPPLLIAVTYVLYKLVPYSFRVNDSGTSRRKYWRELENMAQKDEKNGCKEWSKLMFPDDDIILEEDYWVNNRGMCLLTSTMTPKGKEIEAVVCFCHGFMDNASFLKRFEYQRLVRRGIAVCTIEYEGHGRSDGELGYIPHWDKVINDVSSYFTEVTQTKFPGKKRFLMGESMGGAVVFDTYQRCPEMWQGVVLVCPMCKIADNMLPPKFVVMGLQKLLGPSGTERLLGFLPIAPAADASELSFKLFERRDLAQNAPSSYMRKPRLTTGRELLLASTRISQSLKTFDASFIVLHGLDDKVTDPCLSQCLFDESPSRDKEIKLYPGMWHTLTSGEPSENIELVFKDVITWIEARI